MSVVLFASARCAVFDQLVSKLVGHGGEHRFHRAQLGLGVAKRILQVRGLDFGIALLAPHTLQIRCHFFGVVLNFFAAFGLRLETGFDCIFRLTLPQGNECGSYVFLFGDLLFLYAFRL